jgi:UDP-2,4-diacetamido-2,4,6-trideoxy-beta-L-altropyranose hydrolase
VTFSGVNRSQVKAVIVTEGFEGTGYGHLMRCLSLYQAFEERGITPTYIADSDDIGGQLLGHINLVVLDWRNNRDELARLSLNSDVVIIDSYLADAQVYEQLRRACRQIVCLDDFLRIPYPPGVIVNGTIGAHELPYPRDPKHIYLLGIDYIPLRKEFWDVSPRISRQKVENVLLMFGGQDIRDMADKTLSYLLREFPEYAYHVVKGLHWNGSEDGVYSNRAKVYRNLSADDILQLMLRCDVAVSAAGQTMYELARIGIPTIVVGVAENQRYNIQGWIEKGFQQSELWWEDADLFQKLANEIRGDSSTEGRKSPFCDGQGARRIVEYLSK